MTAYTLTPPATPAVAVVGATARYAVRRVFCVGRNYAEHAREMGGDPKREPPFFFMKPATALLADGAALPYPPRTRELHHEVELVVALASGGRDIAATAARGHIYGYAVGNDCTRRDLQAAAKKAGRPWDVAKGFDHSAGIGPLVPVAQAGHPRRGSIWLTVNGADRQRGDIADMIWSVEDVLAELSTLFELGSGDLVYTGTPAGVGAVAVGDVVTAGIDGIGTLSNTITAPASALREG
jgi:fumarylpyruvate hydrolase